MHESEDTPVTPAEAGERKRKLVIAAVAGSAIAMVCLVAAALLAMRVLSDLRPPLESAEALRRELSAPPATFGTNPFSRSDESTEPLYVVVTGTDGTGRVDGLLTFLLARIEPSGEPSVLFLPAAAVMEGSRSSLGERVARGGPAEAVRTAKRLTGLPVHHYVSFELGGLAEAIDGMGGVRLDERTATYASIPREVAEGGCTLDGRTVARMVDASRESDGESARQGRVVLGAAMRQAKERLSSPAALPIILGAAKAAETDMRPAELLRVTRRLGAMDDTVPSYLIEGRGPEGRQSVSPADATIRETVREFASGPSDPR